MHCCIHKSCCYNSVDLEDSRTKGGQQWKDALKGGVAQYNNMGYHRFVTGWDGCQLQMTYNCGCCHCCIGSSCSCVVVLGLLDWWELMTPENGLWLCCLAVVVVALRFVVPTGRSGTSRCLLSWTISCASCCCCRLTRQSCTSIILLCSCCYWSLLLLFVLLVLHALYHVWHKLPIVLDSSKPGVEGV